jgi:hypothetical protein
MNNNNNNNSNNVKFVPKAQFHPGAFVTWSPDGGRSLSSLNIPSLYPQGKRVVYPMATRLESPQNVFKPGDERQMTAPP